MYCAEYSAEGALPEDFWSDDYCGRRIAAFNHYDQWHVYLDDHYQHNLVFATAEHARQWLMARIDTTTKFASPACA